MARLKYHREMIRWLAIIDGDRDDPEQLLYDLKSVRRIWWRDTKDRIFTAVAVVYTVLACLVIFFVS